MIGVEFAKSYRHGLDLVGSVPGDGLEPFCFLEQEWIVDRGDEVWDPAEIETTDPSHRSPTFVHEDWPIVSGAEVGAHSLNSGSSWMAPRWKSRLI